MPAKKRQPIRNAGNAGEVPEESGNSRKPNKAASARSAAINRLIQAHPDEWAQLLGEEREKVGLPVETGRKSRIQTFAEKMIAAGVEPREVREAMAEAGFKVS